MKRLKLKAVKRLVLKPKVEKKQPVYYSGFCVTDNQNFALFNVPDQFLVDNGFGDVLDFHLSEDDLWMLIDRNNPIKASKGNIKVTFPGFGMVNRSYFDLFISLDPDCQFYPVTEWFGNASNRLIVGLPEKAGKPIGILKTVTKED